MKTNVSSPRRLQTASHLNLKPPPQTLRTNWTWQLICAVTGLAAGTVAILCGTLLSAAAWLVGRFTGTGVFFGKFATLLFVAAIPLLAFGAHCLDLVDKRSRAAADERRR